MKEEESRILAPAYQAMKTKLGELAATVDSSNRRVSVSVSDCDVMGWLCRQPGAVKTYWADRELNLEMAGWGSAHELRWTRSFSFHDMMQQLRAGLDAVDDQRRYYGCVRFLPGQACQQSSWAPFGAARFVIPRFELFREAGKLRFSCNLHSGSQSDVRHALEELESLVAATCCTAPRQRPHARADHPERNGWQDAFNQVSAAIRNRDLEKVVLARRSDFDFTDSLYPMWLLKALARFTPQCYHFCFQTGPHHGFLGATPELLCERTGRELRTEAVAGTRRRGKSTTEDDALTEELLNSAKDRREHQFVVDSLKSTLEPFCTGLRTDNVDVLKLSWVQHLCLHASAELREGVTDADVLAALHPTPAVGGFPTQPALKCIQALEPFERGGYAGPVGWVSADRMQFGVGIRSGLVHDAKLELYAGAGLVEGSDAGEEWNEIEDKLGSFLNCLLEEA